MMNSVNSGQMSLREESGVHSFEYGSGGVIGLAVPQANPVVEPEMAALVPAGFSLLTTRLRGSRSDSRRRFQDYLENLEVSLEAYDNAKLNAIGYACTGTSYIVGAEVERRRLDDIGARFGYPIVTSTQAINEALGYLGARRIALFSPYPDWLTQLSKKYWEDRGFEIVSSASINHETSDTRNIYSVTTAMIMQSIGNLQWNDADVILFTGTGMPTLRAINEIAQSCAKPVLSSNLCLAWELVRQVGSAGLLPPPSQGEPLFGGWANRIPV